MYIYIYKYIYIYIYIFFFPLKTKWATSMRAKSALGRKLF